MDYGALLARAWQSTWRHRFMWVFGLFAVTTTGSCSGMPGGVQYRIDSGELERVAPGSTGALEPWGRWIADNPGIVLLALLSLLLLALAVLVISMICQGAMARATSDAALERPASLDESWQTGLRSFWRYLGLWLLLIAIAFVVAFVFGFLGVVIAAGVLRGGEGIGVAVAVLGVLIALAAVLLAVPLFIATSIVVAYAQRAIVVEDAGPLDAIRRGISLLRRRPGASIVVWLLSLALGIGIGVALLLCAGLLLIPLGGIGALLFFTTGLSAATIAYVVLAGLAFIAAAWFLAAIANTFFWHLWTLAYLDLSGRIRLARGRPPAGAA